MPFGEAMHLLMTGEFGLPVQPVQPGDFGWNRIVHDVVLRAISEPLGDTQGIAVADDVRRVLRCQPTSLVRLLQANIAIKANPFEALSCWFGSKALVGAVAGHSPSTHLS